VSFIIVASCVLALFLIGWRAGLRLIQHARAKTSAEMADKPEVDAPRRTPHRVP
jgi:hypothetical protein